MLDSSLVSILPLLAASASKNMGTAAPQGHHCLLQTDFVTVIAVVTKKPPQGQLKKRGYGQFGQLQLRKKQSRRRT